MGAIGGEYEDKDQAVAICGTTYRDSKKKDKSLSLSEIKAKINEVQNNINVIQAKVKPVPDSLTDEDYDKIRQLETELEKWIELKVITESTMKKTAELQKLGTPKTDAERAKEHFNISDEAWKKLSPEKRKEYINKLPAKGSGLKDTSKVDELTEETIQIISKADERFIIGGYANVYMLSKDGKVLPDLDNEVVTLDALEKALEVMMAKESRRNNMLIHTNIQIGEIIWTATDSEGVTWKTHVVKKVNNQYPKLGLFILSDIYNDTPPALEARKQMEAGLLLSFSIGGLPLETKSQCDEDKCWTEVTSLYLAETSNCFKGKNVESKAFILKYLEQPESTQKEVKNEENGGYNYIVETIKRHLDGTVSYKGCSNTKITEIAQEVLKQLNKNDEQSEENLVSKEKEEKTLTTKQEKNPVEKIQEIEQKPEVKPIEKEQENKKLEKQPVEKIIPESNEPKRADFECAESFFKAYQTWIDGERETTPVTMKQLDSKLDLLKTAILAEIKNVQLTPEGLTIMEAVKKSVPLPKASAPLVIDMAQKLAFLNKNAAPKVM